MCVTYTLLETDLFTCILQNFSKGTCDLETSAFEDNSLELNYAVEPYVVSECMYRALCSWLRRPPDLFRNMTLWGCSAREMATVTSVESNRTEQCCSSLPTGHTKGIVPQFRLHWRRPVSTEMDGGALKPNRTRELGHQIKTLMVKLA